jgi:hypothetical protein
LAAALSAALLDVGAGLMPALGSPERAPLRLTAPSGAAAADERAAVEVPAPSDKAMAYYRSGNVWWIAGTALVKLQEDALANPRPGLLFKLWRESHPPLGERIDFTNEYHPWRDGRPLAYGDRFKR